MKMQRMGVICVLVAICGSGAARAMSVDEALGRLQTYQLGRDNEVVDTIRDAPRPSGTSNTDIARIR